MAWIACHPKSELYRHAGKELCLPVRMRRSIDPLASRTIRRFCQEQKIDVVNTHSSTDSWVCYPLHLGRWPVVRSRQITNPVRPTLDRAFIYRHGCAQVLASADCIKTGLVAHTRLAPERIEVIGEGTDMVRFNPGVEGGPLRAALGVPEAAVLFGLVAMLRPEKGHQVFIEAATRLLAVHGDKTRFVMVGEGVGDRAYEHECRRLVEARFGSATAGPIVMMGYRQDVPQVMAALDVLVVPSLADAQSLVIPQAFATGRPVIASRVGGLPELVKHEQTGLLVQPGDAWELTSAMTRMADDGALRGALGRQALEFARTMLSFDRKMEECVAVYARLASQRRAVPEARKAARGRNVQRARKTRRGLHRVAVYATLILVMGLFIGELFAPGVNARFPKEREKLSARVSETIPVGSIELVPGRLISALEDDDDDDDIPLSLEELAPMKYSTDDEQIIG